MPTPVKYSGLSHEQLMSRFQADTDGGAIETLAAIFTQPALNVAGEILGSRSTAEDAVQEAFLRVVRQAGQYDPGRPFSGWFYTILRNVCIDIRRKQARHQAAIREYAARSSNEPDGPDEGQTGFLELMQKLPRGERNVLVLRIAHDMSLGDIAASLGITEEAAKKRAQRGLQRLREKVRQSDSPAARIEVLSPCPYSERKVDKQAV